MRNLPASAVLSSELLWWELLIDASQFWGNRLKKRFWESLLEGSARPSRHGVMPCAIARSFGGASCSADDEKATQRIFRVYKATHITSLEQLRRLIWAVSDVLGFVEQSSPMKAGLYPCTSPRSIIVGICSGSGSRKGKWTSWDDMSAGGRSADRGLGDCALECFESTQQGGIVERENDSSHLYFLHSSCVGQARKGHHALTLSENKGLKQFTTISWSARGSKDVKDCRPLFLNSMFRRAMSTSTEKQHDEELGPQQSPIQQQSSIVHQTSSQPQSSGQQQSSLDISDSKPQGGPSWPNPDNAASYVLMSNIYADGNRWDEVKRINEMRLKARAWKKPGKAYVEIKAKVHEFIVGDRTHQDSVNIYEKLRKIKRHMGHIGYVPNVDLILENRSYYDPYKPR